MKSFDEKSSYYDAGGIPLQSILKAKLTSEQRVGFYLGNVLKYASRLNFKGFGADDARKLSIYAGSLADLLERIEK